MEIDSSNKRKVGLAKTNLSIFEALPKLNITLSSIKNGIEYYHLKEMYRFFIDHQNTNDFIRFVNQLSNIRIQETLYIGCFLKENCQKTLELLATVNPEHNIIEIIKRHFRPYELDNREIEVDYYIGTSYERFAHLDMWTANPGNELQNDFLFAIQMSLYFEIDALILLITKYLEIGNAIERDIKNKKRKEEFN